MKNVLIIGTTGVLGRELVPRLKAKGYKVRGLVRPESKEKLEAARAAG
ncbi:MAG: NAD-dependent epimerase/dehydratase family protein, partial [Candidatus Thermochlorobacter sp.]